MTKADERRSRIVGQHCSEKFCALAAIRLRIDPNENQKPWQQWNVRCVYGPRMIQPLG